MPRADTLAIVLTPVAAMATFALGLRVGAATPSRAAIVYAAPPSVGRRGLAWQVLTIREERGLREAVPMRDVSQRGEATPTPTALAKPGSTSRACTRATP
jgi:hypothetical protein